jgi:hypothetical protein
MKTIGLFVLIFVLSVYSRVNQEEIDGFRNGFLRACNKINKLEVNSTEYHIRKTMLNHVHDVTTCLYSTINNTNETVDSFDENLVGNCSVSAYSLFKYALENTKDTDMMTMLLKNNLRYMNTFFQNHKIEVINIFTTFNKFVTCVIENFGNIQCEAELDEFMDLFSVLYYDLTLTGMLA